jgi:putative transposase
VIESLTGQGINVQQACVALGVSQSGYYAWKDRPDAPRTLRRIWLAGEIADVHKESGGTYGALRVTAELKYGRGIAVGHNAVGDIMRQLGLKGLPRRRLPRGAKLSRVTSLDLVGRKFRRDRPNELWVTDITEHPTREGKVYCCVVLDTFSRKVVGWSIDSSQTTSLVLGALGMATLRRPDRDGLVMHSDRGVQFTSWAVSHNLTQAGISPSMGAVGSAYDNALMESFWGRMQVELLDRRRWKTRIELATAIHDYIELWHNPRRRHSALGMRTPDEVETAWLQANSTSTTADPARDERAAAGTSARLRRAPAPTADITPTPEASEPAVTITNDTNHAA